MERTSSKGATIPLRAVQDASSEPVFRRGVQYYRRKKVLKYEEDLPAAKIEALVIGSEPQPYKVSVTVDGQGQFKADCSCPYFEDVCKHSVAVLLTHVARANPGIRFDIGDNDRGRDGAQANADKSNRDKTIRAKDLLDDPRLPDVVPDETREFTLGLLILEKTLALIVGTVPDEPQGKANILKIPPEILNILEPDSRIYKLAKYLTSLPQALRVLPVGTAFQLRKKV